MNNEADFFVAGGTLRTSAPSYVTRPADAALLQYLQAGEFCYVLTPRQMGKSSLMVRTAQRLRAEGTHVVIIDLTSIGASSSAISADQWYLGLLSRMRSDLRLTRDVQAWWQAHSAFSVAQRFTDFLQQVVLTECADKVVILIDEIDSTLNLPFRDDFFAAIRAIYNERANNPIYNCLTFALFGVATPTDLIQDRERTPFNVGHRIDLREFTIADAEPLRQGLASRLPEQANAIFRRIFYWTNGHPYLTQKLCQAVVLHTTEWRGENIEQAVDQLVNTAFFSEEGRKDPNLTFVQDRILTSPEREQRQMLRLYRQVRNAEQVADDNRSLIQNRLELYGLVGVAQGMLKVRNRIYEQVFTPAWVDSMMPVNRQQRIAVIASALALALLIGVISILSLTPNPTCDELSTRFTQNANDSSTRLSALDLLLQQGDACRTTVSDLFYGIDAQEQLALFEGLSNPSDERGRLKNVIGNIYLTLDTEPEHDQELMKRWAVVLKNAGLTEDDTLVSSITYWQIGRQASQQGNFQGAINAYKRAINALENKSHPILHYDLALALIETKDYSNALQELDEVVRFAEVIPVTPTPTLTATSLFTSPLSSAPSSILSPLASFTPSSIFGSGSLTEQIPNTIVIDVSPSKRVIFTEVFADLRNKPPVPPPPPFFLNTYLRRFDDADKIKNLVKEKILGTPALLAYLNENSGNYQYLANLELPTEKYGASEIVGPFLEPCVTEAAATNIFVVAPTDNWQQRLIEARPGDTILFRGGTYQSQDKLWLPAGAPNQFITLKPYNCEPVMLYTSLRPLSYTIISGLTLEAEGVNDSNFVIRIDSEYQGKYWGKITQVIIQNNIIRGGKIDAIRISDDITHVTITGNHIDGGASGHNIFVTSEKLLQRPDQILITNNRLTKLLFDTSAEDMLQVRDVGYVEFTYNTCTDGLNMEQCIDIKTTTQPLLIAHNLFDGEHLHQLGNGEDGSNGCMIIHESDAVADQHVIEYNYFKRCKYSSIRFASGPQLGLVSSGLVRYNLFYQTSYQEGEISVARAQDMQFLNNRMICGRLKLGSGDQSQQPTATLIKNNIFYKSQIEDNTTLTDLSYVCSDNLLYATLDSGFKASGCKETISENPQLAEFIYNFYLLENIPFTSELTCVP